MSLIHLQCLVKNDTRKSITHRPPVTARSPSWQNAFVYAHVCKFCLIGKNESLMSLNLGDLLKQTINQKWEKIWPIKLNTHQNFIVITVPQSI